MERILTMNRTPTPPYILFVARQRNGDPQSTEADIADQVSANYNLFDFGFLQRLEGLVKEETDVEKLERIQEIQGAVASEMNAEGESTSTPYAMSREPATRAALTSPMLSYERKMTLS